MRKIISIKKYLDALAKLEELERNPGVTLFLDFITITQQVQKSDSRCDEWEFEKIKVTTKIEEMLIKLLRDYKVNLDRLVLEVNRRKPGMLAKSGAHGVAIDPKKVDWLCIFEQAGLLVDKSWRSTYLTKHHIGKKENVPGNFGGGMSFGRARGKGQLPEDNEDVTDEV